MPSDTTGSDVTTGGLIEVSAHVKDGRIHPYVRFDQTSLPEDGGPYLSLRETDAGFTRVDIPEFKAGMTGVAFDVKESYEEFGCVAAPIRNSGRAIGAVSVTGPVNHIDWEATAEAVRQTANRIWNARFAAGRDARSEPHRAESHPFRRAVEAS